MLVRGRSHRVGRDGSIDSTPPTSCEHCSGCVGGGHRAGRCRPHGGGGHQPNADPILIEAAKGRPNQVDVPAPPFTLTDTSGHSVSLSSLRGRTVVLTFLDPVCTSDCPIIAQSLRLADENLGADARNVELVAVVNNPLYRSTALTAAFDRQEGSTM